MIRMATGSEHCDSWAANQNFSDADLQGADLRVPSSAMPSSAVPEFKELNLERDKGFLVARNRI
jgi:hypothetical protein